MLQLLLLPAANAQPPNQQRLLDREPFERITLSQSADGKTLDVLPLDLPQRPLAAIPASGKLKVRLLERPTEEFELSWTNVARIRVFEQLLLDEARRLTEAGHFDEAYDYFARLSAEYPSLPGLQEAVSDYLRRNALALYQGGEHDRALALLLALYQREPKHPGLETAVEKIAGEIIERYLREGDYAAARSVLILWQSEFRGLAASAASQWQRRFEAAAAKQARVAAQLTQDKQYVAARKAVGKALAIWPQLDLAAGIAVQIQREFPFVTVGVLEAAPREPKWRIDSWPSLRAVRLTQRLLAEQVDFGAEGGVYRSPLGQLALDDTGRRLSLQLDASAQAHGVTADGLARHLLSLAQLSSPHFRPDFATLLAGVAIGPPGTVALHFSRIHVRPESLLQLSPPAASAAAAFSIDDSAPNQRIFVAATPPSHQSAGLQAIVEQTMPDDEAAVTALVAGEIDILERVPPWHLERLRAIEGVRVESYRLPTVHVLIPNLRHPLLAKREFRRALCFGIDRRWIVERVLLGAKSAAGFDVLSGPFPAGLSLSDPVRYGYNNQIAPRPFEPRLAAILATVAWSKVHSASQEEQEAASLELPELTLAHPTDPVARLACQSIQAQLERQGITLKLEEFTAGDLLAGRVEHDLRYAELAVWEPVADARRLFGPGSLTAELQSPYLDGALRELDEASNWNDVRARLAEVHEIAHHELPLVPLWQTINFFAYRTSVRGIGESPLMLYQNADQWSTATAKSVAQLDQDAP